MKSTSSSLDVSVTHLGMYPPVNDEVTLLLPKQETRSLEAESATILSDLLSRDWREITLRLENS